MKNSNQSGIMPFVNDVVYWSANHPNNVGNNIVMLYLFTSAEDECSFTKSEFQLIGPWEIWMKFLIGNFQTDFRDW